MRVSRILAALALSAALPLVAPPAAEAQIPTPESVLGYTVGSDFELTTYERSLEYFEALAAASDRVELRQVGETSFGRPRYMALVSSPENLVDRSQEFASELNPPGKPK